MPFRSIFNRRSRRKISTEFNLQLTAMLDILVVILVFLLKSQATGTTAFQSLPGMQLPYSKSPSVPMDSLHLIITTEAITFEQERIVDFAVSDPAGGQQAAPYQFKKQDLDDSGLRVLPLYDALLKAREHAEMLRAKSVARDKSGSPLPFDGVLAIQADSRVNYNTLRKIMYTAASAGYKVFQFIAMKRDT